MAAFLVFQNLMFSGMYPNGRPRLAEGPRPDGPNIDVDELRDRVEADPARVQRERGVAQGDGADTGNADVNRLGQHVLTVLGDAGVGALGAQEVVAPGGAVAADN